MSTDVQISNMKAFKLVRGCKARHQFDKNRLTERLNCKEGDRFSPQALVIVIIAP